MKVMVTGGAGFIGSHIVDLLIERNYSVVVIDNLKTGKLENLHPKAKFYQMDITSKEIVDVFQSEKPDFLIHEAAQIKVPSSIKDPINDATINIIGSINLLEACIKSGVKKVIYPSSAAIFGEPAYLPIDERHPLNMISGYGISKHTVEHYLSVYKHLYDLNYAALRYSNVFGKRQDSSGEGGVVAIFADKFAQSEVPTIFGDGEQIRDFVYVKDVARANLLLMESDQCGIFNVCTGEKTTVNQLIKIFGEITGNPLVPVYTSAREGDIRNSYMTYEKINREIGWSPSFNVQDGLKDMLCGK